MAEASYFKFGTQLGFAKAHHKITPRGKVGWPWARGLPKMLGFLIIFLQRLGLGTSNFIHDLGLPRPTIKPHPEEKWEWPWEAPKYLGFPFNISATAALSSERLRSFLF